MEALHCQPWRPCRRQTQRPRSRLPAPTPSSRSSRSGCTRSTDSHRRRPGVLGGLHATADGHVCIHDSFPHHRDGKLALLGLSRDGTASREDVTAGTRRWTAVALETAALDRGLARSCDVLLQGYRPGSLAALTDGALTAEQLAAANPGIVCANLSAFGPPGPWAGRRGFDSLVQACSGMNVSEAEHWNSLDHDHGLDLDHDHDPAPRPMSCQALDHAVGYLLAAGIAATLYRRRIDAREGRITSPVAYRVDVSLAAVMKYLRSLGQYPDRTGFDMPGCHDAYFDTPDQVPDAHLEEHPSGFGMLCAVRHSAKIDGCALSWDIMPKPLGSDEPEWL